MAPENYTRKLTVTNLGAAETDWIVTGDNGEEITRVTADSKAEAEQLAEPDTRPSLRGRTITVSNARFVHTETVEARTYAGLVGTDTWEMLEQRLVELHRHHSWPDGTYRLDLTTTDGQVVESLERELPEPPAYAALSYKSSLHNRDAPIRAAVVTLVKAYPGSTIRLVAEHFETFSDHHKAKLSTPELTEATGYELPEGTPRPVSPYYSDFPRDEIPANLL